MFQIRIWYDSPQILKNGILNVTVSLNNGILYGTVNGKLNNGQHIVLQTISDHSGMNANQLNNKLNIPISTINKYIGVLVKLKLIERLGSRKTGGYYLKVE